MGAVLGLSLTRDDLGWVLVDADGAVLDHDALELEADTEIAGAAARGAHAIAAAGGLGIDRIRLAWVDEAARDGLRLRSQLRCLGFADVEAVPSACALAVQVRPEDAAGMSSQVALAYGAAMAIVHPGEAITEPVPLQTRRPAGSRRMRAVTVAAVAAAALAVVGLAAGAAPAVEPAPASATQPAPPASAWVAVPAAPVAAETRTIVVTPTPVRAPAAVSAPASPVSAPASPVLAPAVAAAPAPIEEGQPHLSGPPDAIGPVSIPEPALEAPTAPLPEALPAEQLGPAPGPESPALTDLPSPEMTVPVNLFTALP